MKRDWKILIIVSVCVVLCYIVIILIGFYHDKIDDAWEKELQQQSYIRLVNDTEHKASVFMYFREDKGPLASRYDFMPHEQSIVKEDIPLGELFGYFGYGRHEMDSALLLFDDTLYFWQVRGRTDPFYRHYLFENYHGWDDECIVIREERHRPYRRALFREGIRFVISERDYEAAQGIVRYNGMIIRKPERK